MCAMAQKRDDSKILSFSIPRSNAIMKRDGKKSRSRFGNENSRKMQRRPLQKSEDASRHLFQRTKTTLERGAERKEKKMGKIQEKENTDSTAAAAEFSIVRIILIFIFPSSSINLLCGEKREEKKMILEFSLDSMLLRVMRYVETNQIKLLYNSYKMVKCTRAARDVEREKTKMLKWRKISFLKTKEKLFCSIFEKETRREVKNLRIFRELLLHSL